MNIINELKRNKTPNNNIDALRGFNVTMVRMNDILSDIHTVIENQSTSLEKISNGINTNTLIKQSETSDTLENPMYQMFKKSFDEIVYTLKANASHTPLSKAINNLVDSLSNVTNVYTSPQSDIMHRISSILSNIHINTTKHVEMIDKLSTNLKSVPTDKVVNKQNTKEMQSNTKEMQSNTKEQGENKEKETNIFFQWLKDSFGESITTLKNEWHTILGDSKALFYDPLISVISGTWKHTIGRLFEEKKKKESPEEKQVGLLTEIRNYFKEYFKGLARQIKDPKDSGFWTNLITILIAGAGLLLGYLSRKIEMLTGAIKSLKESRMFNFFSKDGKVGKALIEIERALMFRFSAIKDSILKNKTFGKLFTTIDEYIGVIGKTVSSWFKGIETGIRESKVGGTIIGWFYETESFISKWFGALREIIGGKRAVGDASKLIDSLMSSNIGSKIIGWIMETQTKLGKWFDSIGSFFKILSSGKTLEGVELTGKMKVFSKLFGAFKWLGSQAALEIEGVVRFIYGLWAGTTLMEKLKLAFAGLIAVPVGIGEIVGKLFAWCLEKILGFPVNVPDLSQKAIAGWFDSIGIWIGESIGKMVVGIQSLFGDITPTSIYDYIKKTIKGIGIWIGDKFTDAFKSIGDFIKGLGDWFTNIPAVIGQWVNSIPLPAILQPLRVYLIKSLTGSPTENPTSVPNVQPGIVNSITSTPTKLKKMLAYDVYDYGRVMSDWADEWSENPTSIIPTSVKALNNTISSDKAVIAGQQAGAAIEAARTLQTVGNSVDSANKTNNAILANNTKTNTVLASNTSSNINTNTINNGSPQGHDTLMSGLIPILNNGVK